MARELRNLSARPLFATTPDRRLYVEREADRTIREAVNAHLNVALLGERGAGTTSLLHALEFDLGRDPSRPLPLFVNASGLDADAVLALVRGGAAAEAGLRHTVDGDLTTQSVEDSGTLTTQSAGDSGTLTTQSAGTEAPNPHLVVLLDGADLPTFRALFATGRDDRWREGHTWVLAIPAEASASYLAPPADSFAEVTAHLGGASTTELEEMLARRVGPHHEIHIPEQLEGLTPREVITAARTGGVENLTETLRAAQDLDARATKLGRPAAMLFDELRALGAASASDPRLLDRLGWTAARAGQVFRVLLDEGLVEYSDEREGRPGRPRRIYRVKDAT
nr:hypothetical protein [Actinomycetales bacterium]